MKRALIGLLIVGAIGAGAGAYYIRRGGPEIQVNTSPITRGDIVDSVGATGTLQAVTDDQLDSHVSGDVQWRDAECNSLVRRSRELIPRHHTLSESQVEQAPTDVTRAKADV